jgi:hypothetical protein
MALSLAGHFYLLQTLERRMMNWNEAQRDTVRYTNAGWGDQGRSIESMEGHLLRQQGGLS